MTAPARLDVLVPTRGHPDALAVTMAGLAGQVPAGRVLAGYRVVISDQSDGPAAADHPAVLAMRRVLEHRGCPVEFGSHQPRRG